MRLRTNSQARVRRVEDTSAKTDESLTNVDAETVGALLETARDLLRAEDARTESFVSRGGAVGGFAGIIASLAGGLGAPAISDDLGKARLEQRYHRPRVIRAPSSKLRPAVACARHWHG